MSRHRITAEIPVPFSFPGLAQGEHETANVTFDIEYDWDDTFCNLEHVTIVKADGLTPGAGPLTQERVADLVQNWLDGPGFDRAEAHAKREDLLSEGL